MPGDDGTGETRGWDRVSLGFFSRKPYVPDVVAADLQLPNEAGVLRTLWLCAVCAVGMTVLYLFFPLLMLGIFVPLGIWFGIVLAAAPVLFTVVLFFVSTVETRHLRVLARQIYPD